MGSGLECWLPALLSEFWIVTRLFPPAQIPPPRRVVTLSIDGIEVSGVENRESVNVMVHGYSWRHERQRTGHESSMESVCWCAVLVLARTYTCALHLDLLTGRLAYWGF